MKITRTSMLTDKVHTMDIPVTMKELCRYYEKREHLQSVWPHLPAHQREFIKTGITDDEWNTLMPEER
jgi:hypothetical protein